MELEDDVLAAMELEEDGDVMAALALAGGMGDFDDLAANITSAEVVDEAIRDQIQWHKCHACGRGQQNKLTIFCKPRDMSALLKSYLQFALNFQATELYLLNKVWATASRSRGSTSLRSTRPATSRSRYSPTAAPTES